MKERMRPLLGSIGFSGLEIDVYLALLEQPNASGYQVAQKMGKLVGSTYKALDSLRAKGAVVGERDRAADDVRSVVDQRVHGRAAARPRRPPGADRTRDGGHGGQPAHGGIFELASIAQVYERCRNLLRGATDVAFSTLTPGRSKRSAANWWRPPTAASKCSSRPAHRPGFPGAASWRRRRQPQPMPGPVMNWVSPWTTGNTWQAFIKSDGSGVEEAIWVRQPRLARQVCYLFQSDFTLTKVRAMVQAGREVKEIGREMTRLTRMAEVQALPELLPQEWVLTDARRGIQKRRKALAAGIQVESGTTPSQVKRVTLRQIEYIMVATSRTVVMEAAELEQHQPPPDRAKPLPLDPDAYIEPLY